MESYRLKYEFIPRIPWASRSYANIAIKLKGSDPMRIYQWNFNERFA